MAPLAKLLVVCLILTWASIQISEADGGIATYWGQYGNDEFGEDSLAEACATGLYAYINIATVTQFGNGHEIDINLAGHCTPDCTHIGEDIKTCQNLGVKVFISLGGFGGDYNLTSVEDAKDVADQLWNKFLGGTDSSAKRPFGDAVLDGVDFDLVGSNTNHDDFLAFYLKEYSEQGTKPVYLSAAPQCPYPDYYLQNAIDTELFDFIWVRFYDNLPCEYNNMTGSDGLLSAWNKWTSSLKGSEKLFLGVPASTKASSTGYIPADVLNNQILPEIKDTSRYGGVMVWNRYYDVLSNYSASIIDYVNLELIRPIRTN